MSLRFAEIPEFAILPLRQGHRSDELRFAEIPEFAILTLLLGSSGRVLRFAEIPEFAILGTPQGREKVGEIARPA